jgi:predicted ATPase/DNA-binding CsgD family transcriptional regulator/DNA-binding XRE family transcriptional regulator
VVQGAPMFGMLLRAHRLQKGLTQEELALRAAVSVRGLQDLESGARRRPHPRTVQRLARGLALNAHERARLRAARSSPVGAPDSEEPRRERSPIIGREQEVGDVSKLLASGRLVSIIGTGGVGKTRVALAVLEALSGRFPDGQRWVELASISDPHLVAHIVARALGIRDAGRRTPQQALSAALGNRRALLALDNCEHVADGCKELVRVLLDACPRLVILVTSRSQLRVTGEVTYALSPLETPGSEQAVTEAALADYPAVRLFDERARAVLPEFKLTPAAAQICSRLDGLPLAIELAASRVRMLSASQILGRLDSEPNLLRITSGDRPPRHRTLEATLDWSYSLLDEQERRLFRRVAVFSGGWDLDAMEQVCVGGGLKRSDILDLATSLADKSLLVVTHAHDATRYRLLEPVRQYALNRLAEDMDAEPIRRQHADFYLNLCELAAPWLRTARQVEWTSRLERDHHNLRASLRWAQEHNDAERLFRMCNALAYFWRVRAHLAEGQTWLEVALNLDAPAPQHLRARGLVGAGQLAVARNDFETATERLNAGLTAGRAVGDRWAEAMSLLYLGLTSLWQTGQIDARSHTAVALFQEIGDSWGAGVAMLGAIRFMAPFPDGMDTDQHRAILRGFAAEICPAIERATELLRKAGEPYFYGRALLALAGALHRLDEQDRAVALAAEGAQLIWTSAGPGEVPAGLDYFAQFAAERGEHRRYVRLTAASDALRERYGDPKPPAAWPSRPLWSANARRFLGDQAYAREWRRGQALDIEHAMAYALKVVPSAIGREAEDQVGGRLTRREREVATLIAQGLTDREIAERLVITEGTVGSHVAHIFDKLGMRSRASLATWIAEIQRSSDV